MVYFYPWICSEIWAFWSGPKSKFSRQLFECLLPSEVAFPKLWKVHTSSSVWDRRGERRLEKAPTISLNWQNKIYLLLLYYDILQANRRKKIGKNGFSYTGHWPIFKFKNRCSLLLRVSILEAILVWVRTNKAWVTKIHGPKGTWGDPNKASRGCDYLHLKRLTS